MWTITNLSWQQPKLWQLLRIFASWQISLLSWEDDKIQLPLFTNWLFYWMIFSKRKLLSILFLKQNLNSKWNKKSKNRKTKTNFLFWLRSLAFLFLFFLSVLTKPQIPKKKMFWKLLKMVWKFSNASLLWLWVLGGCLSFWVLFKLLMRKSINK